MAEEIEQKEQAQAPVLSLILDDLSQVYRAYLSFVKKGAIFIPTKQVFEFGDTVSLSLHFLKEPEPYTLQGKVVWVMTHASGESLQGVGVQLQGKEGEAINEKIKALLQNVDKDKPTDTI